MVEYVWVFECPHFKCHQRGVKGDLCPLHKLPLVYSKVIGNPSKYIVELVKRKERRSIPLRRCL